MRHNSFPLHQIQPGWTLELRWTLWRPRLKSHCLWKALEVFLGTHNYTLCMQLHVLINTWLQNEGADMYSVMAPACRTICTHALSPITFIPSSASPKSPPFFFTTQSASTDCMRRWHIQQHIVSLSRKGWKGWLRMGLGFRPTMYSNISEWRSEKKTVKLYEEMRKISGWTPQLLADLSHHTGISLGEVNKETH